VSGLIAPEFCRILFTGSYHLENYPFPNPNLSEIGYPQDQWFLGLVMRILLSPLLLVVLLGSFSVWAQPLAPSPTANSTQTESKSSLPPSSSPEPTENSQDPDPSSESVPTKENSEDLGETGDLGETVRFSAIDLVIPPVTIPQTQPLPPTTEAWIPLASSADRISWWNEKHWVAVGLIEEQSVQMLDLATGKPIWQEAIGFSPTVVRIDPTQSLVYASGPNAPGIVVLRLETGELVKAYGLASGALDIALDPEGGRIFATIPKSQSLAVIRLDQPKARHLPMPAAPLAVAYDPKQGQLLVTLSSTDPLSLAVVNPDNGELLARWRSGGTPEDIALAAGRVVLLNSTSQELTILDLESNGQELQRIGLDWRPTRLALSPDAKLAYVTSRDNDRLQIVDLVNGRLETAFAIGDQPTGILSIPNSDEVLVVEAGIPRLHWMRLGRKPVTTLEPPPVVNRGAISGEVRDIGGNLVTSGSLTIAATPTYSGQTQSIRKDGSFLLADLPAGVHLVDVQVPGFPPMSLQVQVRSGFVATQTIQLPPAIRTSTHTGIGLLADTPPFSDELARHLQLALKEWLTDRQVMLLTGPLGPDPKFVPLQPLVKDLTILDRDERYTEDLARLKVVGDTLGLRYIILTQIQITQGYNRQGSALVNTALRVFAPIVPVSIPNLTPNQLRSRGLAILVDLDKDRPGDKARYFEATGRDDVGGDPMFEEAAAGLFRLQVRNMIPSFISQWKNANPFVADPSTPSPSPQG
jgi:DNA-binding beta-propeller fold protein YncE